MAVCFPPQLNLPDTAAQSSYFPLGGKIFTPMPLRHILVTPVPPQPPGDRSHTPKLPAEEILSQKWLLFSI